MNSEVIIILKNLRYHLIKIDDDFYIIDKDKPFLLVFLLPFIYWLFPKRVRKISAESANLLQTVPYEQTNNGKVSFIGVGVSLILANLIGPTINHFDIALSPIVAGFIIFLVSFILLFFRGTISNRNKHTLFKQLHLQEDGNHFTLWTRPKSMKTLFFIFFMTIFVWAFVVLTMLAFIIRGNVPMLIIYIICLFVLLFINIMTITPGKNTMKFRIKK